MIGKGIFSFDDHKKFGELYDELSEVVYLITYVPKSNKIVISTNDANVNYVVSVLEKFGKDIVEIKKGRGTMVFIQSRW